jgi:hypothetical protein
MVAGLVSQGIALRPLGVGRRRHYLNLGRKTHCLAARSGWSIVRSSISRRSVSAACCRARPRCAGSGCRAAHRAAARLDPYTGFNPSRTATPPLAALAFRPAAPTGYEGGPSRGRGSRARRGPSRVRDRHLTLRSQRCGLLACHRVRLFLSGHNRYRRFGQLQDGIAARPPQASHFSAASASRGKCGANARRPVDRAIAKSLSWPARGRRHRVGALCALLRGALSSITAD